MTYGTLYIEGQPMDVADVERIQLAFPAEDGCEPVCRHCGDLLDDEGGHVDTGRTPCDLADWGSALDDAEDDDRSAEAIYREDYGGTFAAPEDDPGTWTNSAAITVDADDNSVTVSLSVGDPRGAFCMTLRRTPNGELVLHVPHEGMALPHMPLTEVRPGTLIVGGWGR